jgi:hypothetical protein
MKGAVIAFLDEKHGEHDPVLKSQGHRVAKASIRPDTVDPSLTILMNNSPGCPSRKKRTIT